MARARALFYHLMITRHLPEAAQVENGSTGLPISKELAIYSNPVLRDVDGYRRRILKRLPRGLFGQEAHASVPHNEAIRSGSRAMVVDLFRQAAYYEDLFEPGAVHTMLDNHLTGRANAFMLIDAMVTLILWRKQFGEQDGPVGEWIPEEMQSH
jgi:hypothetical protein